MDDHNVYDIAASLGLSVGKGIGPCPWCGAESRSTAHHKDRRLPIGVTRDGCGWICHVCHEKGGRKKLREKLGGTEDLVVTKRVPLQSSRYMRPDELTQIAAKSVLAEGFESRMVRKWLTGRGLPSDGAGVVLARDLSRRSKITEKIRDKYLVVAPMHNHAGRILGMKYRSIYNDGRIKELSPSGYMCSGLAFMSANIALSLARADSPRQETLIVAEGLPDTIVLMARYGHAADVIGVVSGTINSHWGDTMSRYKVVVLATHDDHAGADYADRAARACVEAAKRNGRKVPALLRMSYRGCNDANDLLIEQGSNIAKLHPIIDLYGDLF